MCVISIGAFKSRLNVFFRFVASLAPTHVLLLVTISQFPGCYSLVLFQIDAVGKYPRCRQMSDLMSEQTPILEFVQAPHLNASKWCDQKLYVPIYSCHNTILYLARFYVKQKFFSTYWATYSRPEWSTNVCCRGLHVHCALFSSI